MAPKLCTHRRQKLVAITVLLPRSKPLEKGRGKDVRRDALFNSRVDRPAAFARILDRADKLRKTGILGERHRAEIEKPG